MDLGQTMLSRLRTARNLLRCGLGVIVPPRCPVCRSLGAMDGADRHHTYVCCRRCGHGFAAGPSTRARLLDLYDTERYPEARATWQGADHDREAWGRWSAWKSHVLDALGLRELEVCLPGRGRALEIGCAEGRTLEVLRDRGWRAVGVEPSRALAGEARARGFKVLSSRVEELSLDAASIDLLVMFHVLEHLVDPVLVLGRLRALLRPAGALVLEVPAVEHRTADHLHQFSFGSLRTAVRRAGLEPLREYVYEDGEHPGMWNVSAMVARRE